MIFKIIYDILELFILSGLVLLIQAGYENQIAYDDEDEGICPLIGIECDRAEEQVGDHLCPECDEGE